MFGFPPPQRTFKFYILPSSGGILILATQLVIKYKKIDQTGAIAKIWREGSFKFVGVENKGLEIL